MGCPFARAGGMPPPGHPSVGGDGGSIGSCPVFRQSATLSGGDGFGMGGCPVMTQEEFTTRKSALPRKKYQTMDLLDAASVIIQFLNEPSSGQCRPIREDVLKVRVKTTLFPSEKKIKEETLNITIGRISDDVPEGLMFGMTHLEVGAKANILCTPSYSYAEGTKVNGVTIPKDGHVKFEVEVVDQMSKGVEFWCLSSADRLARLEYIYEQGLQQYDKEHYDLAAMNFEEMLDVFESVWLCPPEEKTRLKELEYNAHVHAAASHYKQYRFGRAIQVCEEMMREIDENCIAAHLIKGKCLWKQGNTSASLEFLKEAKEKLKDTKVDHLIEEIENDIKSREARANYIRQRKAKLEEKLFQGHDIDKSNTVLDDEDLRFCLGLHGQYVTGFSAFALLITIGTLVSLFDHTPLHSFFLILAAITVILEGVQDILTGSLPLMKLDSALPASVVYRAIAVFILYYKPEHAKPDFNLDTATAAFFIVSLLPQAQRHALSLLTTTNRLSRDYNKKMANIKYATVVLECVLIIAIVFMTQSQATPRLDMANPAANISAMMQESLSTLWMRLSLIAIVAIVGMAQFAHSVGVWSPFPNRDDDNEEKELAELLAAFKDD